MDISPIVLRSIMSTGSNVLLYQQVDREWVVTVFLRGYARISTMPYLEIDDAAEEAASLIEEITGGKFNPVGWIVYGKRLSDSAERQFASLSHGHCAQAR